MLGAVSQPVEQPEATLRVVPDGNQGIAHTLEQMVRFTRQYRTDLTLRALAEQIVQTVPAKSWLGEAEAIQNWIRDNIRYTRDIADIETVKSPLSLFYDRFGDCDDMATLAGTLLTTLGHPVRYLATSSNPAGDYDHVYLQTKVGNRWIGVETTEPVPIGWEPQSSVRPMVRNV